MNTFSENGNDFVGLGKLLQEGGAQPRARVGSPETTWSPPQSPLQEQRIRIRVSHLPFDKPSPGWSWPIGAPRRSMIDRSSVVREVVRVDFFPIFQEGRWVGWKVCMIFGDVCANITRASPGDGEGVQNISRAIGAE